jgi:hypothetical protein
MLKLLVDLRDFCYVWAMRQYGEIGAEQEYKSKLKGVCVMYYLALLALLAILNYKAGNLIPTPKTLEENVFAQIIFGLLLLIPYFFFIDTILKRISSIPIEKNMPPEKFKSHMRKFILFFIIGLALMVLIPWSIDRLLPSLN